LLCFLFNCAVPTAEFRKMEREVDRETKRRKEKKELLHRRFGIE
jgi:hypothetical protein